MAARARAFDWSRTPLGPMSDWPAALRTAVDICLSSPVPMFVWWGPELINIYNDAYAPVLGKRHPAALGMPAREVWAGRGGGRAPAEVGRGHAGGRGGDVRVRPWVA